MIVCLDTATVVCATAASHPYHTLLNAWVAGRFTWAVSTPILLEYEEIHLRMGRSLRWAKLVRLMDLAEMTSGNVLRVSPSFHFRIVVDDPDDNIFCDCAIAADADWLVTDDWHFAATSQRGLQASTHSANRVYQAISFGMSCSDIAISKVNKPAPSQSALLRFRCNPSRIRHCSFGSAALSLRGELPDTMPEAGRRPLEVPATDY